MSKTDVSCMIGHWPFRKIRRKTFEDLKSIHGRSGISCGYVSSLDAIFYNDPFEGDEELHQIIKGTAYRHILTVNPMLPYFSDDIAKGMEKFDIQGVRIYPGYHRYDLDSEPAAKLCRILKEAGLPLFATLRMEDQRLEYIIQTKNPSTAEISGLIKNSAGCTVVLTNIRLGELTELKDTLTSAENVYFDTSGLKDGLFTVEKLLETFGERKMMYGSLHPIHCLKSTLLLVEEAGVGEAAKLEILSGNAGRVLSRP